MFDRLTRDTLVAGLHVCDKIFAAGLHRKQIHIRNGDRARLSSRAPPIYGISDVSLAANGVVDLQTPTNPHPSVAS